MDFDREWYRQRSSRITAVAHVFGILSIILMLVWLLHFRGGLDINSSVPSHILNVHPFLMLFGFIFFAAESMMVYKTFIAPHRVQKVIHMTMHVLAITLGIIGIYAAFKFHHTQNITNMYSLHSWIGLGTFILYGFQWIFGFATFWVPRPQSARAMGLPWHVCFGRALLFMAICTAETGLMQIFKTLGLVDNSEARLINFTGLAILLFGITVDLSVAFGHYM